MAKQQLPELTPKHIAFNAQAAATEDQTTRYVIPLYAIDENKERYALGTAVLLKINDKHFLITAAHVMDENKNPRWATDIEIPGKNKFIPLNGQVIKTPLPPSGKRNDDKWDTAVVQLNNDLITQLDHHDVLDINQVDPSDKPYKKSIYTFTGYPSTKQKMPKNGILTIEPVRYTSGPLDPDKFPEGYDFGPHLGIDYSKKKMIARNGKIQSPPDPHGVSGGGLFRIGTYDDIANKKNKPALVGIAIEDHKTSLIATNITVALEMIRADQPDLSDAIPKSEYFHFDVTKQ
jgi:hypothetical protein